MCAPLTTTTMEHLSILLAVLRVDSDFLSATCHVASCRAPDSAAFSHQDAAQPCEASSAVCESCSGWWVAQKSWDPPRSVQFESSTSRAAKLSIPCWLLQCKFVYHLGSSLYCWHVVSCILFTWNSSFLLTKNCRSNVAVKWIILLERIQAVPGLKHGLESSCSNWSFSWIFFLSVLENAGIVQ